MPLTGAAVRTAKPANKVQRLFDERGLYLEISPGGGKWWRLKYRIEGREKRLCLGTYPDVGLKEARAARDTARKELSAGHDPSAGSKKLVFPSPFNPGKPLRDGTLNSALARMGYKGLATAHAFRTLFNTCANEGGWRPDVIERQLAHEERNDVRAAYNRVQWLTERKKLMHWWGDRVAKARQRSTR